MLPTSETGSSTRRRNGFSLVEILVVMAILAIAAAVVVLTLPGDRSRLRREAERLASRLTHAEAQAVLLNRRLAVRIDRNGYAFRAQQLGEWQPVEQPGLSSERWADGIVPELNGAQGLVAQFEPIGIVDPVELVLTLDRERVQVRMTGAGEVSVVDIPR